MNRLRTPLPRRLADLAGQRRSMRPRGAPFRAPSLARAFTHAQGAGVIGPGAQRLLRTVLVDTLTRNNAQCDVIATQPDLERLLGAASSRLPPRFASALHVTDTLEDAIEYLESKPQSSAAAGSAKQKTILWLATPGADADVVHQTLEAQPVADLIALFNGPWPYGPTHYIDIDGPRRLPDHNLTLLTRDQAITRLYALAPPL